MVLCFAAYLGSVVSAYVPYTHHLMVALGFAAVATVKSQNARQTIV